MPKKGDIVLYNTGNKEQLPAIVVRVNDNNTANLTVFSDRGRGAEIKINVAQGAREDQFTLRDDGSERPPAGDTVAVTRGTEVKPTDEEDTELPTAKLE